MTCSIGWAGGRLILQWGMYAVGLGGDRFNHLRVNRSDLTQGTPYNVYEFVDRVLGRDLYSWGVHRVSQRVTWQTDRFQFLPNFQPNFKTPPIRLQITVNRFELVLTRRLCLGFD